MTARMPIRVVIGDDHGVVLEGLVALLQREPDIEVLAQARNGLELVRLAREYAPDVVITDVSMPVLNGIDAIRRIRRECPACRLLCLSVDDRPQQVVDALAAGASGYVLKENSFEELARGIRRIMQNQTFLSGELVGAVVETRRQTAAEPEESAWSRLTPREREVVQLFSEGCSTQDIAARLHVSAKTIATHREHVFRKLQIHSIAELTRYALRTGLSPIAARRPRARA